MQSGMKIGVRGVRYACVTTAVLATLYGEAGAFARDLQWDPTGTSAPTGSDGEGEWNLSSPLWVDKATGTNTVWSNTSNDSATFGLTTSVTTDAAPLGIILGANITAQNINFANTASGATYSLFDYGDGGQTLTLGGNILKTGGRGTNQIQLINAIQLTAGNHIIATRDAPGDAAPEMTFNTALAGSGSVTVDNSFNYAGPAGDIQYGTTAFNTNNTYTGGTTITSGRLIATQSGSLGTGAVTIDNAGQLAYGGANLISGDLTVNNAITISRSDYATANTNNRYTEALAVNNDGSVNTVTFNNITVNSTDARIAANSNRIILPNALKAGSIGASTAVVSFGGDFRGYVQLAGDNTAYGAAGGTIGVRGGVELEVASEANLGGPTSKLKLAGGTIHATGTLGAAGSAFMTNFGAHDLSSSPINTGLDLDPGQVFTVNNLSGGAIGTRGTGTINFNGTNTFTGAPFYDGGIANINGATTFGGFRLRSSVLNIGNGASLTTTNSYVSIGTDNPDNGTVNVTGNGILTTAAGQDFNVSDNAGTKGTLNISGTAAVTLGGVSQVGKNTNAVGVVNQSGGSLTITRTGNFGYVLGRDNGKGTYNLSGGTFTSAGEVYVGQGHGTDNAGASGGSGTWNQTAGTATISNWFVIGREGGNGTVDLSGGSIVKKGGGNTPIGEGNNTLTNTFNVRGTGTFDAQTGEVWVSNGNTPTIMNVQDTGTVNVNDYYVVGRFGNSKGTLNLSGNGVINKAGTIDHAFIVGAGGGSLGTFNQTGGTLNNLTTYTVVSDGGVGTWNFSAGTANLAALRVNASGDANSSGTVNISGTAALTATNVNFGFAGTGTSTVNLNGGTANVNQFISGAGTGTKIANFNGTQINARIDSATFVNGLTTANVQAGGVKINSNGFALTSPQAFVHAATLGATVDGGFAKSGAGTLILTGANTYTGTTSVSAGTLQATAPAYNVVLNGPSGLNVQGGKFVFDYTGGTSPTATVKSILTAGYNQPTRFAAGQIRSTTATGNRGLGYGDNGSQTTVMYTLYGDATLDGTVDFNDFLVLQNNFGKADTRFDQGNFNYDGLTDFNDFLVLQNNFGQSLNGPAAAFTSEQVAAITAFANNPANQAVPEPASLALIAGATMALGGRRRRTASRA